MPVNPLGRVTPVTSKPRGDEAQPTLLSNPYALADPEAAQEYENGYQYAQTIGHLELAQHDPQEWAYATPPWREGFAAAAKAMGLGEFADTLLMTGKEAAMQYPATTFVKTAMGPLGKTMTGLGAGLGGLALGAGLGGLYGGELGSEIAGDVGSPAQGPLPGQGASEALPVPAEAAAPAEAAIPTEVQGLQPEIGGAEPMPPPPEILRSIQAQQEAGGPFDQFLPAPTGQELLLGREPLLQQ